MTIDYLLVLVLLVSCYTDLKHRKIYNVILFPVALLALGFHAGLAGLDGILFTLKGAALGLILFFPPYLLGGMGAGDVKLLAVVGVCKGAEFVFYSFIYTALVGGAISLFILAGQGRVMLTLRQAGLALKTAVCCGWTGWNMPQPDDRSKTSFPYGVAITLGSLTALAVM